MSGLECSEVSIHGLDYSERIDAEYYKKIYLKLESLILSKENDAMGNTAKFLIGPFGSAYDTSNYVDVPDYRYVRGQDVKPFMLNDVEPRYMAQNDFERLKKYALLPNDILVSVVGTLGNACIITEKYLPAIFSCKSSVIRTETVNPYYLICYLNSKYGHTLLLRNARGAIQQGLNLDDLKTLHIPLFAVKFQQMCEETLELANDILE